MYITEHALENWEVLNMLKTYEIWGFHNSGYDADDVLGFGAE